MLILFFKALPLKAVPYMLMELIYTKVFKEGTINFLFYFPNIY